MEFNILHLSDIHAGNTFEQAKNLAQDLILELNKYSKKINAVVVTGDLFDKARNEMPPKNQLEELLIFFNALYKELEKNGINREDFLFVPGNHDMNLNDGEAPWEYFDKFLNEFYKDSYQNMCFEEHMAIKEYRDEKILFFGFNSNEFIYNQAEIHKRKKVFVNNNQLTNMEKKLSENPNLRGYYKIAFMHHPTYLFEDVTLRIENEILSNSISFNKQMEKNNIDILLHGHKHFKNKHVINGWRDHKIYAISPDSLGITGEHEHSFNILEISGEEDRKIKLLEGIWDNQRQFELKESFVEEDSTEVTLSCILKQIEIYTDDNIVYNDLLKILDEIYWDYDALNLLKYDIEYQHLLCFCIGYRIEFLNNYKVFNLEQKKQKLFRFIENEKEEIIEEIVKLLSKDGDEILNSLHIIEEELLEESREKLVKRKYLAFAHLAAFFTDLYMDIVKKEHWKKHIIKIKGEISDDEYVEFCDKAIKYESNLKHIFVRLKCKNEKSYEDASLIIADFRKRLYAMNYLMDCIYLKMDYIDPEIQKSFDIDNIDNIVYCPIKASIPKLLLLLTGTNIYTSDKVFARELIQNAIDAISFREKISGETVSDSQIYVEIGEDCEGVFFKITDHGMGMKLHMLERYFTTLGRSYYKEYDSITNENSEYNPISNFGIGFLSVFKPCKKIIIETKHFEENIYHKTAITGINDYVLIHSSDYKDFEVGTMITCYFKDKSYEKDGLYEYIKKIMVDVKYNIVFNIDGRQNIIEARHMRPEEKKSIIFIPFDEKEKEINNYDENEVNYKEVYSHGMLIRTKTKKEEDSIYILNAGVLMGNTKLEDILINNMAIKEFELKYSSIYINFPPNWLNIDVSREKAKGFNSNYWTIDEVCAFRSKLYESFKCQLKRYIKDNKHVCLAAVVEMQELMRRFCYGETDIVKNEYNQVTLDIKFQENKILFCICNIGGVLPNTQRIHINYHYMDEKSEQAHNSLISVSKEILNSDTLIEIMKRSDHKTIINKLRTLGLNESGNKRYLLIVLAVFFNKEILNSFSGKNQSSEEKILNLIQKTVMENCVIDDCEREELFSIVYDINDILKFRSKSDAIKKIVENIADDFGAEKDIEPHEFIWEYIIYNIYKSYYHNEELEAKWIDIKQYGKSEYKKLKEETKDLYLSSRDLLLDVYMISSCYVGSMLKILDQCNITGNIDDKYKAILDSGLNIIYMWMLSKYKQDSNNKYKQLLKQRKLKLPENKYNKYLRLLIGYSNSKYFDILGFSEILFWIGKYNSCANLQLD